MKRLLFAGLSAVVLSAITATVVKAETRVEHHLRLSQTLSFNAPTYQTGPATPRLDGATTRVEQQQISLRQAVPTVVANGQLTAFELVQLAYQGYFRTQGIPSSGRFIADHDAGSIHAEQLVQAAVNANRLSAAALTDRGYLNAVESILIGLESR